MEKKIEMARIYFGIQVGQQQARFYRQFTDGEFDNLMAQLGGRLPDGVLMWRLEEERTASVQALPIVGDAAGWWIEPVEALLKMAQEEEKVGLRPSKLAKTDSK